MYTLTSSDSDHNWITNGILAVAIRYTWEKIGTINGGMSSLIGDLAQNFGCAVELPTGYSTESLLEYMATLDVAANLIQRSRDLIIYF